MPQRSVLGPLLFLIYINDVNESISHFIIHHFTDDTDILFSHKSLKKKQNKYVNYDLSQIVQWLRANRISMNASKTEIILFRTKTKTITKHLNFRISGQKVNIVKQTKYLGIYLDEHLTWNFQLDQIKRRLSRSCGLLAKLKYFTETDLLRTVYFAIFDSILRYAIRVWGQHRKQTTKEIAQIQEKAIRIMSFKPKNDPTNPLFRNLKIIKFKDILAYNNCISVHDQLNENLPRSFNKSFSTAPAQHNYNTRGSSNNTIIKSITNAVIYGLNSVKHRIASDWNAMIKDINTIGTDRQDLMKSLKEGIFESNT